jgi:hypothetical protein
MPHKPGKILCDTLLNRAKYRPSGVYPLFGVACCRRLDHLPLPKPMRWLLDALDRGQDRIQVQAAADRAARLVQEMSRKEGWSALSPVRLVSHALVWTAERLLSPSQLQSIFLYTWKAEEADSAALDDQLPPRGRRARRRTLYRAWLGLINDVFPDPDQPVVFDPRWRTPLIEQIAQAADTSRDFTLLPILADALEESGCTATVLLEHLRWHPVHVRGCWALDRVLGRE